MIEALLTETSRSLREEVRAFVREDVPKDLILAMDGEAIHYPKEYLERAAARHLLGLRFPNEYGGRGLPWTEEIVALEEVGVLGTSLACLYSLPSIVGEALNVFGTSEQKAKYLGPTLAGRLCTAEALTEPRGGSDFFGTTMTARREGDVYLLSGQKRFVVGAEGADYFLAYARTDPAAPPHRGISAFIVERGPGVKVEYLYGLLGTRGGGTGRVLFQDARVPAENLVGRENGASDIFYRMMIPERMTTAAGSLGLARAAFDIAARYATKRKAFGRRIKDFQAVSFKIADSLTKLDAASAMVHAAAASADRDPDASRVRRMVSEAKKFATESAWEVVNLSMQVLGGIGYTTVFPVERYLRDARIMMIWTGTNEVMDLIIQHEFFAALEAAIRPGGSLRDLEADARDARDEEKIYE
ncbi:MAG TPA: acyl-CoA dehydrogenase family protein [Bacillota bacterium]